MGKTPHPICGHPEYTDRHVPGSPCVRCLKEIDRDFNSRQPHPHCGCLKPVSLFRTDGGPCGWCLKDIERDYGLAPDPAVNRPPPSAADLRKWCAPLLDASDWVDESPARVAREPAAWVDALRAWRRELLDITTNPNGRTVIPPQPQREET